MRRGGGSSNGTGSTTNPEIPEEVTEETTKAAKSSAQAEPIYGSVSQTSADSSGSGVDVTSVGDAYSIELPSSDNSTISLNTDDHVQSGTERVQTIGVMEVNFKDLKKTSGDNVTHAGIFESEIDSLGHWIVGGYWIHGSNANSDFEFGAFLDGPEISDDPNLPTGGSANYSGEAGGLYSVSAGNDLDNSLGSYNGDFEATANFTSGGGTLSGKVTITSSAGLDVTNNNFIKFTDANSSLEGVEFKWDNVRFGSNGQATGDVIVDVSNSEGFRGVRLVESGGKTGNRFSSETVSESNLNPRYLVGTHGATISTDGGAEAAFVGIHMGGFSGN